MWEAIRANRRKSLLLFFLMGICLVLLGYLVGFVLFPGTAAPDYGSQTLPGGLSSGGMSGVFIALAIWGILSLVSISSGKSIILAASNAKKVSPDVHPQLFNIVEEMKIAANMNKMPEVYIINSEAPNAFATGRNPENSAIAVTAGLLARLNRDELQGVIAHEMSHIINRDVRFLTFAGIMLGAIIIVSQVFLRGLFFSSAGRYRSSGNNGGQGQIIMMILAVVLAILVPILARILYFSISRKREYLADASGVRLTRYPEGLASALEKISNNSIDLKEANQVTAPMYIINPLKKTGKKVANLSSTHPPIEERIRILRAMQHGVNYTNYQQAFSSVKGGGTVIPGSAMKDTEEIGIRSASERKAGSGKKRSTQRNMGDIMMAVNDYSFIQCPCGVKLKIPPDYKKKSVKCPKCGRIHNI
jgi:heat shock protein HtpX